MVFVFTYQTNFFIQSYQIRCLEVGGNSVEDHCYPNVILGSIFTTIICIQTYSSGHFLFGSTLLWKYSSKNKRNRIVFAYFVVFMGSHGLFLNNIFIKEKVCILFKVIVIVLTNGFAFMIISLFMGHEKPFLLMKNFFYFEFFTCTIPTTTILASKFTYPLFITISSKQMSLFFTFGFNFLNDVVFSEFMRKTILRENKYLDNFDLIPGTFILSGYFAGLFFGNLLPQDLDSWFFWLNLLIYYIPDFLLISGFELNIFELYRKFRNKKQVDKKVRVLKLMENGTTFFTIFPLLLTFLFIKFKCPYFYGSQLYDYKNFDWLETTDGYQNKPLIEIVSYDKICIILGISILLMGFGFFKRKHYAFFEINRTRFFKSIFYTFKIFTMFTLGFEYSVQVANVVNKDVVDQMFGPFWRLVGL